ncbi:MAG: MBL fold metallo-hydrolase, partial [Oscillospiraceae bacterium]
MGDTAVTILCDNEGSKGLKTEHGLALLVERPDGALLADCGASGAFIDNARSLGRDLSAVRAVTLSHNHFDHTRGFLSFTEAYSHEYTLWLSSHFFKTSAWRKESDRGALTPTSGPITAASLCKDNVNFKLVGEDVFELPSLSGVYLMCNIPRSISFETADER